jgi:uncharacterized protein YndB with AHSA1/START domain
MSSPTDTVTTTVDRDTASATTVVDAPPGEVFDYLRRPANHAEISGDGSVRGTTTGPVVLGAGDRFGMRMRIGTSYRVTSQVVEYDEGRRIGWCHFFGHRWRWELEPLGDTRTKVTETFDLSTSKAPWVLRLVGLPRRHERNVAKSVGRVAARFASSP